MDSAQSTGQRLLVVDDNDDNRDMLARRLRRRGYVVDTASSGAEALDEIDQKRYDVVLLDVMMPGVNGLEVLQYIRVRYTKTQLPVLMATARTQSEDVVGALRLGANDFLSKPLNFAEVIAALDVALEHEREEDPVDLEQSGVFKAEPDEPSPH